MNPEQIAATLSARFLEGGNYAAVRTPLDPRLADRILPAAADESAEFTLDDDNLGMLSVQSVGHEKGSEKQAVHIYVTKGSKRTLDSLEREVDGVTVSVNNVGNLIVRAAPAVTVGAIGNLFERNGRVACGSSCAPSGENYAGTLGALVRDADGLFCLSNNHVIAACNHVPVGMPILAPANMDGRPGGRSPAEICRHSRIVELRSGAPMLVPMVRADAAIGLISNDAAVSSWQGDAAGYDTPTVIAEPISGMRVKKCGRTTGVTVGTIEAFIATPMPLPYRLKNFNALVWFTDIWTVRADAGDIIAQGGDSGSLVVTEDGTQAVGLLFAANPRGDYAWIAPISSVLELLTGVELVGGHGI